MYVVFKKYQNHKRKKNLFAIENTSFDKKTYSLYKQNTVILKRAYKSRKFKWLKFDSQYRPKS